MKEWEVKKRRESFREKRVREEIGIWLDFEWRKKNIL